MCISTSVVKSIVMVNCCAYINQYGTCAQAYSISILNVYINESLIKHDICAV